MSDAAFTQLLDMGIPGGRARAALKRSKGDVMSAAERVFSGDFDDIPSDDEGMEDWGPVAGSSKVAAVAADEYEDAGGDWADVGDEDGDEAMDESDDGDSGNGDYGEDFVYDDEDDGDNLMKLVSDPYAGVFFSKDRVEEIFEPIEEKVAGSVAVPGRGLVKATILGRGEWMSGCAEGSEQSFLFQLYNTLEEGHLPCSGCGHLFKRKKEDFFALFSDFPTYVDYLSSIIRPSCPKCQALTCLACGDRVDRPSVNARHSNSDSNTKGKSKVVAAHDSLLHCPNVQGAILGVGLHMIDKTFAAGKDSALNASSSGAQSSDKKRKRKSSTITAAPVSTVAEDDDGSDLDGNITAVGAKRGTGYDGTAAEDRSGQIKAERAQVEADKATAKLIAQVREFLPNMNREGEPRASDHLVHPTALAHLRRRSMFVNDLLRNDSLLDMSKRDQLYRTLFDWLEIVSNHEALATMLAMPSMRPVKSIPVPNDPFALLVTYEGSPGPREMLESLVIQATAALKGLGGVKAAEGDTPITEEELRMTVQEVAQREKEKSKAETTTENYILKKFCLRILNCAETIDRRLAETKGKAFVQRMHKSLSRLPDVGSKLGETAGQGATDEDVIRIYEEWAGKARFQYCDLAIDDGADGPSGYHHAYSGPIVSLEGTNVPKRSLAIAKELAILTTNLPVAWHSTIFLRVDEARVDVLKAMIVGPEGTPYENGCFIFDIFLPIDYNNKSPLVKSMTTNGGRYRYNPNLYADGKVCLSLLGTWSGPGWISGQSTLLQVLISIQSLIMCEEPYLNEPAWANDAGTPASKAYSANVRRMTLADAMANNIKSPPYPFEDEVKTHFRLKAKAIRQQIENWRAIDDGRGLTGDSLSAESSSSKSASFKDAAKEVLKLLDELEGKDPSAMEVEAEAKTKKDKKDKKPDVKKTTKKVAKTKAK